MPVSCNETRLLRPPTAREEKGSPAIAANPQVMALHARPVGGGGGGGAYESQCLCVCTYLLNHSAFRRKAWNSAASSGVVYACTFCHFIF